MSFAADVQKWANNIAPQWMEGVTLKVVFELADRAVQRSPVGDASYWERPAPAGYAGGHFRRNWQYGFGTIPSGELDGVAKVATSEIHRAATGKPGVHYIGNTAPYAQRIEDGWSESQAPRGIVNLIELEFPDIVRIASA